MQLSFTNTPRTEIVRGMSWQNYRDADGLNQSLLKCYSEDFKGCPELFHYRATHADNKQTQAFIDGRAFHCLRLEPKSFAERYRILTDEQCEAIFQEALRDGVRSKSRAAFMKLDSFADWKAENGAKGFQNTAALKRWKAGDAREIIDGETASNMSAMLDSQSRNKDICEAMQGVTLADCEVSFFAPWASLQSNELIQLKSRVDIVTMGDALIDLKTCRTTNQRKFAADCAEYGYDLQAAFYLYVAKLAGLEKKRFGFLAQEKVAPFLCCIHWIPDDWLRFARVGPRGFRPLLMKITNSIRSNEWPGPASGLIDPPAWLQMQIESIAA